MTRGAGMGLAAKQGLGSAQQRPNQRVRRTTGVRRIFKS